MKVLVELLISTVQGEVGRSRLMDEFGQPDAEEEAREEKEEEPEEEPEKEPEEGLILRTIHLHWRIVRRSLRRREIAFQYLTILYYFMNVRVALYVFVPVLDPLNIVAFEDDIKKSQLCCWFALLAKVAFSNMERFELLMRKMGDSIQR
ncbi:hypothetical protein RIF29_03664 [Crotalaria pallida]|uniref:Uncharacterized protein n=1 Tax=Crotalaria pallida TaxID=3830 RepID=A0AAN9J061_CROPI